MTTSSTRRTHAVVDHLDRSEARNAQAEACDRWRESIETTAMPATIEELLESENDLGLQG